jgi:hypothetical protein
MCMHKPPSEGKWTFFPPRQGSERKNNRLVRTRNGNNCNKKKIVAHVKPTEYRFYGLFRKCFVTNLKKIRRLFIGFSLYCPLPFFLSSSIHPIFLSFLSFFMHDAFFDYQRNAKVWKSYSAAKGWKRYKVHMIVESDSTEQSPPWDTGISSDSQCLPSILWNLKRRCLFHNGTTCLLPQLH